MALSSVQEDVLDVVSRRMPANGTWCIFGSTDSVLRGLDDEPADIDILATEEAAGKFREQFRDGFVETYEVDRSQIDEYEVNGVEIEVIFSCRKKDHQRPLLRLDEIDLQMSNNRGIPMLPFSSLIRAYRQIDKHSTADKL